MKIKKDTIKWIAVFACIVVLAVFVFAVNTNGFTDFNPYGWFDSKQETNEDIPSENSSTLDVEIHNSAFMSLTAKRLSADVPVTTAASDGITLTATLSPSNAVDKTVDWTVEFVDPSSSWATGKTASNYVVVTPTADGSTSAVVTAKNAFGAQIKVVVTSRANPEATAYCLVDYGQKVSSSAFIMYENENFATNTSITAGSTVQSVEALKPGNWQGMFAAYSKGGTFSPVLASTYTKATTTPTYSFSVKASDSLYTALKNQGIAKSSNTWVTIENTSPKAIYEAMSSKTLVPVDGTSSDPQNNTTKFNNALLAASGNYDFQIKITVKTSFQTKDFTISCLVNRNGTAFQASTVSLNQSSILF